MASVGEIVTKKYGPLPLWAYAVMGGGVGYIFLRSRKKAATAASGAAHTGSTPTGAAAGSYGYSGGQLAGSTYPPLDSFMSTLGVQLTRIQDTLGLLTPVPATPPSAGPPPAVPPPAAPPPAPVQGAVPGAPAYGSLIREASPGWAGLGTIRYVPHPGEYLNEIAARFGITPQQLLSISPDLRANPWPAAGQPVYVGSWAKGIGG